MAEIRRATAEDALIITSHRRLMFEDIGGHDAAKLAEMEQQFSIWVKDKLSRGEYLGWLMLEDGQVVAGAGLWLREWIPQPNNFRGKEGYVGNVYTAPAYRRRGFARLLMNTLLDWCKEQGIRRVWLYASDEGKELYLSLGFKPDHPLQWLPDEE